MDSGRMDDVLTRSVFPGKVGLQQRVLPAYRIPFFDRLAEACEGGKRPEGRRRAMCTC
jgi:hypothetical protein